MILPHVDIVRKQYLDCKDIKPMKILLQHKIFIGYFLLMAIIGSMVAIVLHERSRVQKIENESIAIFQTQHNINTTHRYVTTLVTYGESVMVWNDEDSG